MARLGSSGRRTAVVLGGLVLVVAGCSSQVSGGEIRAADEVCVEDRSDEARWFYATNDTYIDDTEIGWDIAQPTEVGLDPDQLEQTARDMALSGDVASFLVVRDGRLVFERYFNGSDASHANNVHSLSKSILSAVAGVAIAEGFIELDTAVADVLPDDMAGDTDLAVRDLLTMAAGLEWTENETEHEIQKARSHVAAVLDQPRVAPAGTEFLYNTGLTQVLSAVLVEATGQSLCEFAHERLLSPLGIDADHWKVDRDGYHAGGHSLFITPREVAAFGKLVLQDGVWDGEQLVPEEWLDESLSTTWHLGCNPGQGIEDGYGYLWWLADFDGYEVWRAEGFLGQWLHVIPELDLIVVVTHSSHDAAAEDGMDLIPKGPLLHSLISAVTNRRADPSPTECRQSLDLYGIGLDGSESVRLNHEPMPGVPWSLSPDGQRVTVHADTALNFEIYTSATDGSDVTRLTEEFASDLVGAWSPDGQRIVFARGEANDSDLYVINADGSGMTQLTDHDGPEGSPAWAPGGSQIAYVQGSRDAIGFGEFGELWIVNIDGSDPNQILDDVVGYPDWSPDGSRIGLILETPDGPHIGIVDLVTGNMTDLGSGFFPRWSPTGDHLAFVAEGADGQELFIMNVDTGRRRQLTDHPTRVVLPLWPPDGATIMFVADR